MDPRMIGRADVFHPGLDKLKGRRYELFAV
jgi:hypothetical protein